MERALKFSFISEALIADPEEKTFGIVTVSARTVEGSIPLNAIKARKAIIDRNDKGVEISPQSPETHSSDSQYGPFFLDALLSNANSGLPAMFKPFNFPLGAVSLLLANHIEPYKKAAGITI